MIKEFLAGFRSAGQNKNTTKSFEPAGDFNSGGVYSLSSGGFARGGRELIAAYNSNPNLRKVVGIIANSLAATPFYLRKRSDSKKSKAWPLQLRTLQKQALRKAATKDQSDKVWDHEFLEFLYRGSPLMPGPQALKASYAYKEIKGEFFWRLFSGGSGTKPASWTIVPPQSVAQLPDAKRQVYVLNEGGHAINVPAEEIFWFKDLNLSDVWGRGAGVGDSLSDELDSDEYAAQLLRITLANKGFKDTLISIRPEVGANPTLAEELEAKYNQRSRGFYNSGRAMVVDSAQIDVQQLTYDLKELQLLDLRNFERDIIYQTFGVPPELFGLVENSNRSTIDTAEAIFAQQVLVPRLEQLRLEWQLKLLPLFDPNGQYLLDYVSPVPSDKSHRLDVMRALPSAYTWNEWRSESGHCEEDWGKERVSKPATYQSTDEQPQKSLFRKKDTAGVTQAEIDKLVARIDSTEMLQKLGPEWETAMAREARIAFDDFPEAIGDFGLVNPLVQDHLDEFGGRWITNVDKTTQDLVGKAIGRGIDAGLGTGEIAKLVQTEMGYLADGYRSILIARTEAVRSANAARLMGHQATQLDLAKRYISALTSSTRAAHSALHNVETKGLNGTWEYSAALEPNVADTILAPGSSSYAAHSCNCLCTYVAFDPLHKSGGIDYASEAHVLLCKAFEDRVESMGDILKRHMQPFYDAMSAELVAEWNRIA